MLWQAHVHTNTNKCNKTEKSQYLFRVSLEVSCVIKKMKTLLVAVLPDSEQSVWTRWLTGTENHGKLGCICQKGSIGNTSLFRKHLLRFKAGVGQTA